MSEMRPTVTASIVFATTDDVGRQDRDRLKIVQ